MPRYDYKCDKCSHRFVERQSFSSEPVAICPECEGRASRQFVAVPIVFKGSGFYVNDYGKKSSTTKSSSNNESSDSDSKSESKSDSKVEKAEVASSTTSSSSSSDGDSKAD